MSNKRGMEKVTIENLSEVIGDSTCLEVLDLGSASLTRIKHAVMGDCIAVSTAEGTCAIIRL